MNICKTPPGVNAITTSDNLAFIKSSTNRPADLEPIANRSTSNSKVPSRGRLPDYTAHDNGTPGPHAYSNDFTDSPITTSSASIQILTPASSSESLLLMPATPVSAIESPIVQMSDDTSKVSRLSGIPRSPAEILPLWIPDYRTCDKGCTLQQASLKLSSVQPPPPPFYMPSYLEDLNEHAVVLARHLKRSTRTKQRAHELKCGIRRSTNKASDMHHIMEWLKDTHPLTL